MRCCNSFLQMAVVFQPGAEVYQRQKPQPGGPLGPKAAEAQLRERERLHDLAYLSPCALMDFAESCLNGPIPG